jgi:BirA family biotin operon repressor/biotin-[acetyl-CoA-carboxylase] ligase
MSARLATRAARAMPPSRVVRVHLAEVGSTNTYAKEHARGFDAGAVTVVTADAQTLGRGRMDRTWVSGAGDIKATFAFRLPPASLPTAYQLSPLLAVAARRALRTLRGGGASDAPALDVGLKWPNDLIAGGCRKLGGILCELEDVGQGGFCAVLGVGINVNSTPEALDVARPVWPLTTLRAELGRDSDVGALTDALVASFAEVRC